MSRRLDMERARERLAEATRLAASRRRLPIQWYDRTAALDGSARTYVAVLGTALLAKATDGRVDPTTLNAGYSRRAHSARALATKVLTKAPQWHGFDIGTRGPDPFNNYPFRGPDRLQAIDPERVGARYRPAFRRLVRWVSEIDELSEDDALLALAAFVRQRLEKAAAVPTFDLRDAEMSLSDLLDWTSDFVTDDPEEGRRGQAFVAAAASLVFDVVETANVFDPSRSLVGDVKALARARTVLTIEVKQRHVEPEEVLTFARQLEGQGVVGLYAAFAQRTSLDREGLARSAESRFGVVLSVVERPEELLRAALLWSGRQAGDVLRTFPQLMLERLQALDVSEPGQRAWTERVGRAWSEVAARASERGAGQSAPRPEDA